MTVKYHYTKSDILNAYDPIDIILIGCGGSGSQILTGLGQINTAICELGHPTGLRVVVVDPDNVSPSNVGRQLFSSVDVGSNKARILVQRINRFYGLNWLSVPDYFTEGVLDRDINPSIVISAIDNVQGRKEIYSTLKNKCSCYWMDLGNSASTGQVILGTIGEVKQPEGGCTTLPNIFDFYPTMEDSETDNTPSCSVPEALSNQDLFINRLIATFGLDLIWKMFRQGRIKNHGAFVDIDSYETTRVSVESSCKRFNK